jgi:hypothetical protein
MSHEAVRKRLKNLEGDGQASISETETSEHQKILSTRKRFHMPGKGVNASKRPLRELYRGEEKGSSSRSGGLIGEILRFLEGESLEIYRLQVEQEAYQVTDGTQIIRFYVFERGYETDIWKKGNGIFGRGRKND